MTDTIESVADSGMDASTVQTAEWLWSQLPILTKWHQQQTYVKALVCSLVKRIQSEAITSHTKALIEGAGDVAKECTALAVQIDPLLLGGPDARLLNQAAATIAALKAENSRLELLLTTKEQP